MSKQWFAVGPDGGQNGWFAYQADSKFDAIWLYYQEHGAPQAGSERINAEIVPQWQGKPELTQRDWNEFWEVAFLGMDQLHLASHSETVEFFIDIIARRSVEGAAA